MNTNREIRWFIAQGLHDEPADFFSDIYKDEIVFDRSICILKGHRCNILLLRQFK